MRYIHNPDNDRVLVLYTYPKDEKMVPDVHINLQVYSRGYNSVRILLDRCLPEEVTFYDLFEYAPVLYDLPIADLDTMTLYVEGNGYLYAGGIWQVRPAGDQLRYELQCLCAAHLSLVETVELLSTEVLHPVDQVIFEASQFLQARFPTNRFVLLSWEEPESGSREQLRPFAQEEMLDGGDEQTWHVLFQGFSRRGANPTEYTVRVHYHPAQQDEPFTLELV